MNEKISALSDSELERREWDGALVALGRDRELRQAWDRYHLMRAAMRGELQVVLAPDLADRIVARVVGEPATPARRAAPVIRFRPRYAAGLALAASVAAISIYGVRFMWSAAPASPALAAAGAVPSQPASVAQASVAQTDQRQREWENSLNAFLVQHSEYSPTSGMGVMPYVRIAGHDDNN